MKLFQTIKRKGHASSYKNPAQFCQSSSVGEAILFGGYGSFTSSNLNQLAPYKLLFLRYFHFFTDVSLLYYI